MEKAPLPESEIGDRPRNFDEARQDFEKSREEAETLNNSEEVPTADKL